ncbi:MAG: large conductance mechanosensitive channel protein MscL [Dehalococcoidales bacterium]|nr:large conductance mechanosensitive channel protein MscL [Dehalococcoidales bacterium]
MFRELKEFALHGNVVDIAVGIIIGAAFGAIVTSLVRDIVTPPIGLMLGNLDFANLFVVLKAGKTPAPYASLADAQTAGAVTINYGVFVNTVISFILVAIVVFLLIRYMNRVRKQMEAPQLAAAPVTRECPYCLSKIPVKATRCPHCTSEIKAI